MKIGDWIFAKDVLLELMGVLVTAPLVAALVERRRRRRLVPPRRLAVLSLQREFLSMVRGYNAGFHWLKPIVDQENIRLLELYQKGFVDGLKEGTVPRSRLDERLFAIRNHEQHLRDNYHLADIGFRDCQRACERIIQNTSYFSGMMQPEENELLGEMRLMIFEVDDASHNIRQGIANQLHYEELGRIEFANLDQLLETLGKFITKLGSYYEPEPWILAPLDFLAGRWIERKALPDLSPTERIELTEVSRKLRDNSVLMSDEIRKGIFDCLGQQPQLESLQKMHNELLSLAHLAKPDREL